MHPFIVGEKYFDRDGPYEVLAIDGNRITIRYDTGRIATSPIALKARIYQNMLADERVRHPYQSPGFFSTLGFLARRSEFHAEVPPQSRGNFEERYRMIVGRLPTPHIDGYFPIAVETPRDKWGPELRIYFPAVDDLEFPPAVQPRTGTTPGSLRINNNHFWWRLVHLGFRLGTNHDTANIIATVPTRYQAAYNAGWEI